LIVLFNEAQLLLQSFILLLIPTLGYSILLDRPILIGNQSLEAVYLLLISIYFREISLELSICLLKNIFLIFNFVDLRVFGCDFLPQLIDNVLLLFEETTELGAVSILIAVQSTLEEGDFVIVLIYRLIQLLHLLFQVVYLTLLR
jgi:hypothetical protein